MRPESFGATRYPRFPQLALPVMGVWSSGDPALTEAQMVESARYVAPGTELIFLEVLTKVLQSTFFCQIECVPCRNLNLSSPSAFTYWSTYLSWEETL